MRLWKLRSYGNHKKIYKGPWKSRTAREIPTFPQANLLLGLRGEERRMNRPRSGSLSERRLVYFPGGATTAGAHARSSPCRQSRWVFVDSRAHNHRESVAKMR